MVGKDISSYCYPSNIKTAKDMSNGTLILNVIHGNEIDVEYKKQEIIDKINSFFGFNCIKEIKLKIVQKSKKFSDQTLVKYNEKLKDIKNEELKESLNKLIKAYSK